MKLFKSPILIAALAFIGGVFAADMIKPMLAKVPVIGSVFQPKA